MSIRSKTLPCTADVDDLVAAVACAAGRAQVSVAVLATDGTAASAQPHVAMIAKLVECIVAHVARKKCKG